MTHSESVTAVLTANEPADGTVLVVRTKGSYKTVIRDDSAAHSWDASEGDHWFDASDDDDQEPMSLHQHIKYADAVYALGEKLAQFS